MCEHCSVSDIARPGETSYVKLARTVVMYLISTTQEQYPKVDR